MAKLNEYRLAIIVKVKSAGSAKYVADEVAVQLADRLTGGSNIQFDSFEQFEIEEVGYPNIKPEDLV